MTPVITSASRSAVLTILPGVRPGAPDPIQLYADAHNALEIALHYLRRPQANVCRRISKSGSGCGCVAPAGDRASNCHMHAESVRDTENGREVAEGVSA